MTVTTINNRHFIIFIVIIVGIISCKKQDNFLDAKPVGSLSTISTISDVNNLLNDEDLFNRFSSPALGELNTDDYYITSDVWLGQLGSSEQKLYTFASNVFSASETVQDWSQTYSEVYQANIVLDALPKISAQQSQLDEAKGKALFYRSIAFYNLVQTFAPPFDSATANSELGIPLRLSSDLNKPSVRATEKQCYSQVISDLQIAANLLPTKVQVPTQPSRVAAFALLARIYLATSQYDSSFKYANAALASNSSLFDYNKLIHSDFFLTDNSLYPLSEDIYHSTLQTPLSLYFYNTIVDSFLYSQYEINDLRTTAFFSLNNGELRFKGSYEFRKFGLNYDGLATDEMYLIRAETRARGNDIDGAMSDLNILLGNRYVTGTFHPRKAGNVSDALDQILLERRKELLYRGLRWTDLRRSKSDTRFAITLTHVVQGVTYTLPPNDPRYAIPIPYNEITLSGIQQNVR